MTGRQGWSSLLVSTSLKVETVELPPCGSLAMVLLIKQQIVMRQADTKAQWGVLENYITCMETKFPALYILIGGDFNAQLGVQVLPSIEALYSQEIFQAIDHLISARHSKDQLTNFAGIQLALLASQHNKIILNGSTLGDLADEFTFSSSHWSSVIDFVLVSQLLRKAVHAFYVDCLTESDHYPL
ncbi:hypothetical protein E2320_001851, partial [Naja naja]